MTPAVRLHSMLSSALMLTTTLIADERFDQLRAQCEKAASRTPALSLQIDLVQTYPDCPGWPRTIITREWEGVRLEGKWLFKISTSYQRNGDSGQAAGAPPRHGVDENTRPRADADMRRNPDGYSADEPPQPLGRTVVVHDGRYLWTHSEVGSQVCVLKQRWHDERRPVADRDLFETLKHDCEFAALPEERVGAVPVWVIEARRKPELTLVLGLATTVRLYVSQENGVVLRTVGLDESGRTVYESRVREQRARPRFAPAYFNYQPPTGALLTDLVDEPAAGPPAPGAGS